MNLFNKYRKILNKMNLVSDQKGIWNRFIKESGGWTSHLENTKNYILDFCKDKKGTITLLGSGWLLDIPIETLSKQFEKVILIDIFHPAQIKHLVKPYKNVKCVEMDLTGGLVMQIYKASKEWKKNKVAPDLKLLTATPIHLPVKTDYLISVNLLSQLGILLLEYLGKSFEISELNKENFLKNVQQNHLALLSENKACLIGDFEEWIFDSKTNQISRKNLSFIDIPENNTTKKWDWLFDMSGNYFANKKTILKVVATML